jgi:hypothetical protein
MGDLNKHFWGKIGENSWPKHAKNVLSAALRIRYGARRYTPGARCPDRDNTCVVSCLGAWRPTCRGPMHLFKCAILLFSIIYLLKHDLLALTLDFLNDKKLGLRRNRFSKIIGKWTFCEQR